MPVVETEYQNCPTAVLSRAMMRAQRGSCATMAVAALGVVGRILGMFRVSVLFASDADAARRRGAILFGGVSCGALVVGRHRDLSLHPDGSRCVRHERRSGRKKT